MLPRVYAILDVGSLRPQDSDRSGGAPFKPGSPATKSLGWKRSVGLNGEVQDPNLMRIVCDYAVELARGGVTLIQYRAKNLDPRTMLSHARELRTVLPREVTLVMNDRSDLCLVAGLDGVHVGQSDLAPDAVRGIVGPERMVGVSTHNPEQFEKAIQSSADYIAIGPVFVTGSKANADPVVGLAGVRAARELMARARKPRPIVAIGGITRQNARSVIEAGADSVAVIGDLLCNPAQSAEEFLRIL